MPYITSVERIGMQKGFEQGLQQGLLREARDMVLVAIAARFGAVPDDMLTVVLRLEDRETLHALMRQAVTCPTLEALREALPTVQESQGGQVSDASTPRACLKDGHLVQARLHQVV